MVTIRCSRVFLAIPLMIVLFTLSPARAQDLESKPVAKAGLSRYVENESIVLNGTGFYDLNDSGTLTYAWRQIGGPSVTIVDANTATPTISGFVQSNDIQTCEFELIIGNGELTSLPDTVEVVIVPVFGKNGLELKNDSFDPNKPTIIYFGGGDCIYGNAAYSASPFTAPGWLEKANIISFPSGYSPDPGSGSNTYYRCGNMILVYLSAVAPNYKQSIQTFGWSTGGLPAIGVGQYLNLTYKDRRYAINRVTFLDATPYCHDYFASIPAFLGSSVEGEQCWIDNYVSSSGCFGGNCVINPFFYDNILNVWFDEGTGVSAYGSGGWFRKHRHAQEWYNNSLNKDNMNTYNFGMVAGAYWSVIGPGRNLQLASTPTNQTYKFKWYGWNPLGYIDFYDEAIFTGILPEPVTLVGPSGGSFVDTHGVVLSCEVSENATGYQLLLGRDPHHMVYLLSDTPSPPTESIMSFPFEQTWWTVRAYDQHGSTIYADPLLISVESVSPQMIENALTGETYASIQQAINDARNGDEIVISEGTCQFLENLDFKGKSLTIRSTDEDNPDVVAATVIRANAHRPAVTLSGNDCLLAGLTITGGTVGISCGPARPTIRNCTLGSNGSTAIQFWQGYEPRIIDCAVLGHIEEVSDPRLTAHWKLDETEGMFAADSIGENNGIVFGNPVWQPVEGQVDGALEFDGIDDMVIFKPVLNPADGPFSVFAWIKGGASDQVIISQQGGVNWLQLDTDGTLMTKLTKPGRTPGSPLHSETVIMDGNWHQIGFVWDGSQRSLYMDDTPVAMDNLSNLSGSAGGLVIGMGQGDQAATFFSGLIDDVRIYNLAESL